MTIQMDPPNILGYDGAPVGTIHLNGVVEDLHQYEAALNQLAGPVNS